jgi:hypothetical protein
VNKLYGKHTFGGNNEKVYGDGGSGASSAGASGSGGGGGDGKHFDQDDFGGFTDDDRHLRHGVDKFRVKKSNFGTMWSLLPKSLTPHPGKGWGLRAARKFLRFGGKKGTGEDDTDDDALVGDDAEIRSDGSVEGGRGKGGEKGSVGDDLHAKWSRFVQAKVRVPYVQFSVVWLLAWLFVLWLIGWYVRRYYWWRRLVEYISKCFLMK